MKKGTHWWGRYITQVTVSCLPVVPTNTMIANNTGSFCAYAWRKIYLYYLANHPTPTRNIPSTSPYLFLVGGGLLPSTVLYILFLLYIEYQAQTIKKKTEKELKLLNPFIIHRTPGHFFLLLKFSRISYCR